MGKLDGKTALVTGGNSGIGLATAKQFVNEGAYVFITGRREAELTAAVNEIGRNVAGVQGDVSNLADLDRLFDQIKQEKGRLDIVFANAGVARYAALGAISGEFFDSIFDANEKACFLRFRRPCLCCPTAHPSFSMRRWLGVEACLHTASTLRPRRRCARSRGRGRPTYLYDAG